MHIVGYGVTTDSDQRRFCGRLQRNGLWINTRSLFFKVVS